ncbi:hypothetical protein BSL78_02686 [Apostichopus japonicus]|uniref:Endonuclease/exonuclease/phosphatase domain-containing protein n=1 Tax=Stichopus japonicus TaxID=307972 RepID=A0A2G8LJF8_STIJA|nr:hypothetical protein BSL78_02686 [Apostichopus japonicus]
MAITETWLYGDHRDNVAIADLAATFPHYELHHVPRTDRSGGGVLVFLRNTYHVTECDIKALISFEYIELVVSAPSQIPLRLIVLYRPPKTKNKQSTTSLFLKEFPKLIESFCSEPGYVMIVGDFNFHCDDMMNRDTVSFQDLLYSANLKQHVAVPTHRGGHTLDLIISRNDDDFISNIDTTSYLTSDHAVVMCSLEIGRPPLSKIEIKTGS